MWLDIFADVSVPIGLVFFIYYLRKLTKKKFYLKVRRK